jgi:hypothetical protein
MPNLALNGGKKTKQKAFPVWPHYDDKEKAALEHFQSVAPLALWSFTDFSDSRWLLGAGFLQLMQ